MQKILVVDDEKMMLKLVTKILSPTYQIVCASSGAEAVEIFGQEKFDMVLSDLLMPEMDGYELHRRLQEKSSEKIPIMFMTADESDDSESKGFEIGAADYIRKPLKKDILLRRVANILENSDKIHGLKHAANVDAMTGLLNKAATQAELEKILQSSRGALMMIDLDSFKLVNDIYGHGMGDRVLVKFSELLRSATSEQDTLGRMGGDEFIAFCKDLDTETDVADKTKFLNEKLFAAAQKYMGEDMKIPLGVSIGAVFIPQSGKDFSEVYQKADKALYKVKQHGKHGYSIYSDGNDFAQEENLSVQKILGERNLTDDAYFVELDAFKIVYRLAARLVQHCKKNIQFLELTTSGEVEELKNLLMKNLRQSDCLTQAGQNNFYILLMETTADESKILKAKLLAKIKSSEKLSDLQINFRNDSSL